MTGRRKLTDHPEFAALLRRFEASLPAKVQQIERAAAALERAPRDANRARSLFLLVHRLAGSAAMYGQLPLSSAAASLERWLAATAPAPDIEAPDDLAPLPALLLALRHALPPAHPDTT